MIHVCGNCGAEVIVPKYELGDPVEFWGGTVRLKPRTVCPYCGEDELLEAGRCDCCGRAVALGDLKGGSYCRDCVGARNSLTNGVAYLQDSAGKINEIGWIDFVLRELYGITECDYREELVRLLDRRAVERIAAKDRRLLQKMRDYIAGDYDDFALWLSERGRKRE